MLAGQEDKAFHCLTVEEWAKITSILTYSETKVLYYLLSQNPMGDRSIDCRVRTIAEVMKISVGSVSSALKQLEAKGLIESMQIVRAEITIKPLLMSKNAEDYVAKQRGKVVQPTEQQVQPTEHNHQPTEQQVQPTEHEHNIDRVRALKTLNTNSNLITQQRVEENLNLDNPEINQESSTNSLVDFPFNQELKSDESQIVSVNQSSVAVPLSPTTIYRPTKEDEALNFGRRLVPMKGTYASRSSDPWMVDGNNPDPMLVQWVINKKTADQKNLKEAYRSYTPNEVNVKKELRSDYASASDWWQMFLTSVHQQAEVYQARVAAGIPIAAEEHQAIASIAPYTNLPLATAKAVLEPVQAPKVLEPVQAPKGAINPTAYKEFVAEPMPSEEESNEGRKLFSQRFKELTNSLPSMPKSKFIDTPTTEFAKNRAWLHSGEQALRAAATFWAKAHSNDLEIDYDASGNIIDFEEVEF